MNLKYNIFLLIIFLVMACNTNENKPSAPPPKTFKQVEEPLKKVNKYLSGKENALIEAYITRHNYPMESTGTGLRYYIYKKTQGTKAAGGKRVTVNYEISLLNGTVCYTSKTKGAETFLVDQDDIESGLHEGIKFMRTSEKAIFILPPHRAHGLIGDFDKIPPLTTVVYDIELLEVK